VNFSRLGNAWSTQTLIIIIVTYQVQSTLSVARLVVVGVHKQACRGGRLRPVRIALYHAFMAMHMLVVLAGSSHPEKVGREQEHRRMKLAVEEPGRRGVRRGRRSKRGRWERRTSPYVTVPAGREGDGRRK
jgi:hypothetical protein